MPKRLVPNPDYQNARYELVYQFADGRPAPVDIPYPRFNTPYPDTVKNADDLAEWVRRNSLPSHIEVDE